MKTRTLFTALVSAIAIFYISDSSYAQNNITIGSGMTVVSGSVQVSMGGGSLVNDGVYIDTTGTFNMLGGVTYSGTGTTTLNNLTINNTGSSRFNSLISVKNTANIMAGSLDANNNLYLRTDYSPAANMIVTGVLTGDVQGLVTRPTLFTGPCPSYTSDFSHNVSGGVVRYQWQSSADSAVWTNIPGATNITYSANVTANTWYRCHFTTTNSIYNQKTPDTHLYLTGVPAAVTVSGDGPHCVQATLLSTGGSGGAIYFQGTTSGGTSTTTLSDTALVTVSGTYFFRSRSVAGCWGPQDSAQVVINPLVTPAVTLSANPGFHVCEGNLTTFTASPVNGGSTPGYSWTVNGTAVTATGSSYSYLPVDGDSVKVVLTSSAPCPTVPTTAAAADMIVDSNYIPRVTVVTSPSRFITRGDTVRFTAVVEGGGTTPSYQWVKNGVIIAGATNAVYVTSNLNDRDSVACQVVGSGICSWPSFNAVMMNVSNGVDEVMTVSRLGIMPNPNNGTFMIKGMIADVTLGNVTLELTNMLGQIVYRKDEEIKDGQLDAKVEMGDVAKGTYILRVIAGNERISFPIAVAL